MKNAPIIDLSLRAPRDMIAERGNIVGPVLVAWFRLVRPALVGGVWASICIYTYRYLLPFNEAEMPIEQIVFYVTSIALIAGTIVMWLIAGRVVHPFAYRLRVSKMMRRSASVKVRSASSSIRLSVTRIEDDAALGQREGALRIIIHSPIGYAYRR